MFPIKRRIKLKKKRYILILSQLYFKLQAFRAADFNENKSGTEIYKES